MTKLYIVEGLPCSGKSTTSKYVAELLEKSGKDVKYVDEGSGDHPADYEFHAYITKTQLKKLEENIQSKIRQRARENQEGYIVALSEFTDHEREQILPYKIYDFLPWETEKPLMLERWKQFADQAAQEDCIYVFNCVFLQNPMCETMMRFHLSKEESFEYLEQIYHIISPLEPVIIYLKNDDVAEQIKSTSKERPGWLDAVIDYHVKGGFGKSISAKGFDGYLKCLEERQRRELEYLKTTKIPSVIIENAHRNWQQAYAKIAAQIV